MHRRTPENNNLKWVPAVSWSAEQSLRVRNRVGQKHCTSQRERTDWRNYVRLWTSRETLVRCHVLLEIEMTVRTEKGRRQIVTSTSDNVKLSGFNFLIETVNLTRCKSIPVNFFRKPTIIYLFYGSKFRLSLRRLLCVRSIMPHLLRIYVPTLEFWSRV